MAGGLAVVNPDSCSRAAEYSSHLTWRCCLVCIIAGCGGLLFGYDLGIAGGVASMDPFLQRFFPEVVQQKVNARQSGSNEYCQYDSQLLQLWQSSMFLAGAFSGLAAGAVSNRYGRRLTMSIGGLCFIAGSILQAVAPEVATLVVGRILLGVGIGAANQSVPMYLSEVAPVTWRGALNISFQMSTTVGILLANCINYGTNFLAPDVGWRLSLGLAAVPALVFFVGSVLLPDSPNSLVQRGHEDRGRQVLERLRGTKEVGAELADIRDAVAGARAGSRWALFTQRRHLPKLLFSIFLPIVQQYTGINSYMFYAPQIFNTLGLTQTGSLLGTLVVSAVNILATVVAILAVDRAGRKTLYMAGGVQMFSAQVATAALMGAAFTGGGAPSIGAIVALEALVCVFTVGYAYSHGPLDWLVPTEIHTIETRSAGQSVSVFFNFLASFSIAQAFLSIICRLQWATFLFFAGCVALMTIAIAALLPETKGVPIEEVGALWERHWAWRRVVSKPAQQDARAA